MSYEHCDKHDMEATNGCEACEAETEVEQPITVERNGATWIVTVGYRRAEGFDFQSAFERALLIACMLLALIACGSGSSNAHDAGAPRARSDGGSEDAGKSRAHLPPPQHGSGGRVSLDLEDAGSDAGSDGGALDIEDAGTDAGSDGGALDLEDAGTDAGSDGGALDLEDAGNDAGFTCVEHPANAMQDCGHGVLAPSCAQCPDWAHPGCRCLSPDPSFPNQCSCQCNNGSATSACFSLTAACTSDTQSTCGAL